MDKTEKREINEYLVHLLSCSFRHCMPDDPGLDFDWDALIKLAREQMVDNTVFDAVEMLGDKVPPEVTARFQRLKFKAFLTEEAYEQERSDVLKVFQKNQIRYLCLKGIVLQRLYPSPAMRQSADNDILIDLDQIDQARQLLSKEGFRFSPLDDVYHDISFDRSPVCHFELHYRLVDQFNEYHYYFEKVWERALPVEGSPFEYKMTDEDFYVYNIYHFYRHYERQGCGIKFLCDIYIYNQALGDKLDREYLKKQFDILDISLFEENMRDLSMALFEGRELTDMQRKIFDSVMSYGAYGSKNNNNLSFSAQVNYKSKKRRLMRKIFPKKEFMKTIYSKLERYPALLPYYYLKRLSERKKYIFSKKN